MIKNKKQSTATIGATLLLLLLATACGSSNSDGDSSGDGGDAAGDAASGTAGAGSAGSTGNDDGGAGGAAGNGGSDDGGTPSTPTVVSNKPLDEAIDVAVNGAIRVVFSEAMDPSTLNDSSFTLTSGTPAVAVKGKVICAREQGVFWPAAHLTSDVLYTATISTKAKSAAGIALEETHSWTFTTGADIANIDAVELATAGDFAILAKSGISTVPKSVITGDIGVSPAAATYITGFSLSADATNVFATATQVKGKVYAANYKPPTPAKMTTAIGDMAIAFTDAASRAPDVTELGAGNIGGMTLEPGVYKWGTGLLIPTDVKLSGSATDVWIFQIAQNLTVSNGKKITLEGGALPKNVFWQVSGKVTIGTTAHVEGIVLSQTSITLGTGASVNGRLLAQKAVAIDSSTVTQPAD